MKWRFFGRSALLKKKRGEKKENKKVMKKENLDKTHPKKGI